MKHARSLALVLAVALSACATMPVGGVSTPTGPSTIPSSPLDLGDWRNASDGAVLQAFQGNVASRYAAGTPISSVAADLRRNDFNCGAAPPRTEEGRGDPPAQVCRRTTTASGCTHTWQVHLFDQNGALAHTRGLYDRRCGGDGLLGGPG